VAVLRYEKRTKAHGPRIPSDIGLEEEVVADALAAVQLLRNRPEIDKVFLLGHSLGGILAPVIARRDGGLAGIALLAAPARPFFHVLEAQLQYLKTLEPGEESPGTRQVDSLLALVRGVEAGQVPDDQVVLGAPPPYWRELAAVNPVRVAEALEIPLIVLQGGRDYQSTAEDLAIWENVLGGRPDVMTKLYPDLNHLFMPGHGMATPQEYASTPGHVAEEVILDLTRWADRFGGG
jgi:alpha-beta hydrolase superfamily lysophospholipase